MSFAKSGFVASGPLGTARRTQLGQAIPIPVSAVTSDIYSDCPGGFRNVFGVCQMNLPAYTVWSGSYVLAGRGRPGGR